MKTRNLILATMAALSVGIAVAGCGVEGETMEGEMLSLLDPCTGEEIGAKDMVTGVYYFDDGRQIDDGLIEREFVSELADLCPNTDVVPYVKSNVFCWQTPDGDAPGCSGCCTYNDCWEECIAR